MCEVEVLLDRDFKSIEHLLLAYKYKPYWVYAGELGQAAITGFFFKQVRQRLQAADVGALCHWDGDRVTGLALWSPLSLESEVFGFRAARLDLLVAEGNIEAQRRIKQRLVAELLHRCDAKQVRHLSVRVEAADMTSIHVLEEQGFILVDGLITYSRRLDGPMALPEGLPFEIRRISPEDVPEAGALARSAYIYDRLHADPAIPRQAADEMHGVWLESSCSSGSADQVLVAVDEMGILGYSVYRVNHDTMPFFGQPMGVWIIAATAERARHKGVARSLCLAMLNWYHKQGVQTVEGGTQLANVASARLHESCGFRVASTSVSMSRWIGTS